MWSRRGRETLIDLPLLRVGPSSFGLSLGTFYFAGFTAIFLVLTLYLQVGLGYSALRGRSHPDPVRGRVGGLVRPRRPLAAAVGRDWPSLGLAW